MVKDPIRRHEAAVSDAAVLSRTGRSREEWYALLDQAGATAWTHRGIARWLADEHDVDGWWRQSITVGYEQERGLRVPGQQSDGRFAASASATLEIPVAEAVAWVVDPTRRGRWLDQDPELRTTRQERTVLWSWPDGTKVDVRVTPLPRDRSRIALSHAGLPDAEALATAKAYWRERFEALRGAVERDTREG